MSDKRNCYVYVLYREDGVTPFYVGKGQGERWADHEKQAHRKHTYKNHVILGILAKGMSVLRKKVAENLTSQEACDLEVLLIAQYGRYPDGILTNRTAGGEGLVDPSQDVRDAISRSNKGKSRPWTEEQREAARNRVMPEKTRIALASALKGNQWNRGRVADPEVVAKFVATRRANGGWVPSDETRAKISATLTGRKFTEEQMAARMDKMGGHGPRYGHKNTPEHNEAIAAAQRGRVSPLRGIPRTDDVKAKIAERNTERNRSPEQRAAVSRAHMGKIISEETRERLTEANRRTGAARRGKPISDEHRANLKLAWETRREREIAQGKHQPKPPVDVSRSEAQKRRWEAYRKAKADGQSQESADA